MAGDEITEQIVHNYLVDFKTAEMIKIKLNKAKTITFKDIMGLSHKVEAEEILKLIEQTVDSLADKISKKIMELNGGKSTNAVFCVGGGGQLKNFTNVLAKKLELPHERVALRGAEVLDNISFINNSLKIPEMVTPVGICLCGLDKDNNDFISIKVNGEEIKIFNNNNLTLVDVVAYKGFNHKNLICRRGNDIHYELNGESRKLRGETGEPASILVNGEIASLNHPIHANDEIMLKVATHGKSPTLLVEDISHEFDTFDIYINDNKMTLPYKIIVNNEIVNNDYVIKDNDTINIDAQYSIKDILEIENIESDNTDVYISDVLKSQDYIVVKNDKLIINIQDKDEISNKELIKDSNLSTNISVNNREIKVYVNDKEIIMRGKETYIFVDIFDYIDFNLKNPKGKIICLVNGRNASYMENINAEDKIEVYWDK
jgi:molybdopterin converting factor small subunit